MNYDEYNDYCRGLTATSHVVQWGGSHVWKVDAKVFAIGGWTKSNGPAYTFKTSELNFEILKDEPGFRPAPYLASRSRTWIQIHEVSCLETEKLKEYLSDSHRIVSLSLTKKKQKELDLNQS